MNWGWGTFDPRRGLLIVIDMRLPAILRLVPTNLPEFAPSQVRERPAQSLKAVAYQGNMDWMLSPAGAPCLQPPHGMLSAIDIRTRKVVWQVPTGTAKALGLFGKVSHLPIPIGTVGAGGPMTTAGGLTFRAATLDRYLRAYDNATGKEIWKAALPEATAATPMSYVSPKTGKQYVLVSDGGSPFVAASDGGSRAGAAGGYVIAFALPEGGARGRPSAR